MLLSFPQRISRLSLSSALFLSSFSLHPQSLPSLSLLFSFFSHLQMDPFSSSSSSSSQPCKTQLISVEKVSDSELDRLLLPAVELLQNGEVVAFPTETVYGLGASALSSSVTNFLPSIIFLH